jgi:hypothetical protein
MCCFSLPSSNCTFKIKLERGEKKLVSHNKGGSAAVISLWTLVLLFCPWFYVTQRGERGCSSTRMWYRGGRLCCVRQSLPGWTSPLARRAGQPTKHTRAGERSRATPGQHHEEQYRGTISPLPDLPTSAGCRICIPNLPACTAPRFFLFFQSPISLKCTRMWDNALYLCSEGW